jgi:hypothetical protein
MYESRIWSMSPVQPMLSIQVEVSLVSRKEKEKEKGLKDMNEDTRIRDKTGPDLFTYSIFLLSGEGVGGGESERLHVHMCAV